MNLIDYVNEIDLANDPCNLTIVGKTRTGKSTLATKLIEKLIAAKTAVTLIDSCYRPHLRQDAYEEIFMREGHRYHHTRHKANVNDDLLCRLATVQMDDSDINYFLTARLALFERSVVFVDEINSLSLEMQYYLATITKSGQKNGIYSIHILQSIEDATCHNFNKKIFLDRPLEGFHSRDWGYSPFQITNYGL